MTEGEVCSACRGLGIRVGFDGKPQPCGECGEALEQRLQAVKLLGEGPAPVGELKDIVDILKSPLVKAGIFGMLTGVAEHLLTRGQTLPFSPLSALPALPPPRRRSKHRKKKPSR